MSRKEASVRNMSLSESSPIPLSCFKNTALERTSNLSCKAVSKINGDEKFSEKESDKVIQAQEVLSQSDRREITCLAIKRETSSGLVSRQSDREVGHSDERMGYSPEHFPQQLKNQLDIKIECFDEPVPRESEEEVNHFKMVVDSDEHIPNLTRNFRDHKDARTTFSDENEIVKVHYGDSCVGDPNILIQQHATTKPKQIETECTESGKEAPITAVKEIHACQMCQSCKLASSSDQHLKNHVKYMHKEKHQGEVTNSSEGKCNDEDFNCFDEEDCKLSISVSCSNKMLEDRDNVVEKGNGDLVGICPCKHYLMSKEENLCQPYESGHQAIQNVNVYSGTTHQQEGGLMKCCCCGEMFSQDGNHNKNIKEIEATDAEVDGLGFNECYMEQSLMSSDCDDSNLGQDSPMNHFHGQMRVCTEEKPHICDKCGKMFNRRRSLYDHMRNHTRKRPFKCNECGKTFCQSSHLDNHRRMHTGEKPFKCSECGKVFSQRGSLCEHMKTHTGERPFKCGECGKVFSQSGHLYSHMRSHTGERLNRFKCDECGKTFDERRNFADHLRTHTGEKPFECDECGKAFGQRRSLLDHLKTHTGEKLFKCRECGRAFCWSGHLYRHMRTHTGEKPFKCDECGKTFSQGSNMRKHLKIHTGEKPFKCNECGKDFCQSSQLYDHMRIHTRDYPFKCDECGKKFGRTSHLQRHMRTHIRKYPFKCDECGKNFSNTSYFQRHMRTHTHQRKVVQM